MANIEIFILKNVRVFLFRRSFDPNQWCVKNGLHNGGLNPGPLGHESSALTTRPQLLTLNFRVFYSEDLKMGLVISFYEVFLSSEL